MSGKLRGGRKISLNPKASSENFTCVGVSLIVGCRPDTMRLWSSIILLHSSTSRCSAGVRGRSSSPCWDAILMMLVVWLNDSKIPRSEPPEGELHSEERRFTVVNGKGANTQVVTRMQQSKVECEKKTRAYSYAKANSP